MYFNVLSRYNDIWNEFGHGAEVVSGPTRWSKHPKGFVRAAFRAAVYRLRSKNSPLSDDLSEKLS